jgi:hypothetical protein
MKSSILLPEAGNQAFLIWLRTKWKEYNPNTPLMVDIAKTVTDLRQFSNTMGDVSYPYAIMSVARVAIDTEKGGMSKRFHTIKGAVNSNTGRATMYRLTPVKVGLVMQFRTDNIEDIWNFVTLMYDTAPGPALTISETDSSFEFQCRANFTTDFDFPFESADNGNYMSIDTTIVMNSWMGTSEDVGVIRTVNVTVNDGTLFDNQLVIDEVDGKVYPIPLMKKEISYTDVFDSTKRKYER